MNLKKLTYTAVLVLNFNIMISDVETLDDVSIYKDMVGDHLDLTERTTAILGLGVLAGYGTCLAYLAVSFGPLAFRRR